MYSEYKKQEYDGNPEIDRSMYVEKKERWEIWEKRKRERYNKEVELLKKLFPLGIKGTIIKLDCSEEYTDNSDYEEYTASSDYREKTGVDFLEEETLIIGNSDNGIRLIFKKVEGEVITRQITEKIYILDECDYDQKSRIYKWFEPAELPVHLKSLIIIDKRTINNIVNNIDKTKNIYNTGNNINGDVVNSTMISNFKNFKISEPGGVEDFLERNYKRGGIHPLIEMKRHPEWVSKYRREIEVVRMHICKSCKRRWMKNCCGGCSRINRSMLTMVIGWHKPE